MPASQQKIPIGLNQRADSGQLVFRITPIGGQSHRIQPELGDISVTLDVDVRRFIVFQTEEEEHVGADAEHYRHSRTLS
jgi:hypothetical protein